MVKNLSIYKIRILSLKYKDNNYKLLVRFNPSTSGENGFHDQIECEPQFLEILEFQGNGINISITSSKYKIIEDDIQCFIIFDLDGNYIALADLSLTKFYLLDSGAICSEEEFMQATKAKKRQQLYDLLKTHINNITNVQNELKELEVTSLNFKKPEE